jgi:uncharacterized UPF0160 family protein
MIDAMRAALKELEDVLECINQDKIPFDGDDFHETLRTLRQAIAEAEKESTLQEISDIGQEIEPWDTSDMAHRSGGLSVEQALDGLAETSREIEQTPDHLLRQSEREGWRYAKECESEIKRLKELSECRLQLLMKMPEQKEWQGLTDEDIDDVTGEVGFGYIDVSRAIEAKLRERNT